MTDERKQTDKSLREERLKADNDLIERRAAADEVADAVIETARARADQVLAVARLRSDRAHPPPNAQSAMAVQEARDQEDHAVRAERAAADKTLREERRKVLPLSSPERDMTDQDLSHERARADQALAQRDAFLAIVSHDLRNMLAGMVGFATGITSSVSDEKHDEQIVRYAQGIQRIGAGMSRLVGDLVDIASVESGMLAVSREIADPALVAAEAVEHFQVQAAAKRITLTTEIIAPLPIVSFDPARILQVLVNLINNAIKFTPPEGEIVVRVEGIGDELSFAVADTGEGIPEAKLDAIFERYQQVTEKDRRGMGLGLYISKCIVLGHGGRIWVDSVLSTGSTFRFTLPPAATDTP